MYLVNFLKSCEDIPQGNPNYFQTAVSTSLGCHCIRKLFCLQKQYLKEAAFTSSGNLELWRMGDAGCHGWRKESMPVGSW